MLTFDNLRLGRDERGAAIGMTGSGKSVLAQYLIPDTGKLGIIDPKRMFKYDAEVFDNPRKILFHKPKRFIYRPTESLLDDLLAYDVVYKYLYTRENGFVYTDDMVGIMDRTKYPRYFRNIYQMGREKHVAALTAFQRPSWLPLFLMSEANKFYIFKLVLKGDIQRICEFVPYYNPHKFTAPHQFFYYDISDTTGKGEMTKLNIKKG